jgi:hypothetical protein
MRDSFRAPTGERVEDLREGTTILRLLIERLVKDRLGRSAAPIRMQIGPTT